MHANLALTSFISTSSKLSSKSSKCQLQAARSRLYRRFCIIYLVLFSFFVVPRASFVSLRLNLSKGPHITSSAPPRHGGQHEISIHGREEEEEMWANMSQSERDAKRNQSARSQTNIAAQVVAFSKLPPNLKSRCHCGKKKAYGKCCFKTDMCPCGNGKKFYKCCAKERGY